MKEEVKDSYGIVYFIFVLLGTGMLLPFNVFLTEKEFYDVRFQVKPYNAFVADNFMSLFCMSFNTLNLVTLAFLIKYQKFLSLRVLVLQPLVITFIMLGTTSALALKTDVPGAQMAKYTLPSIALMGVCTALLQGGVLQLASIFSPVHIRGCVSGIAIGGVVTSCLSFFSQLQASDTSGTGTHTATDVAPAAFLYFSASAAVIAMCITGYAVLPCLPYGRYKLLLAGIINDPKERKLMTVDDDYEEPLLTVVEGDGAATSSGSRTEYTRAAIISVESDYSQHSRSWQRQHAFYIYCLALFFCFVVTMGVHPGITSFLCSVKNPALVSPCASMTSAGRLYGDLFVPLIFVLFNVGDFLGRSLAGYGPWARGAPVPFSILAYSLLRGALAAGFMFCHLVMPTSWKLPQFFELDIYPWAFITLLGITQGHLISTICTHAPSTLLPTEQSKYGPVTSFAISLGSFLGSFVTLGLVMVFQTH